MQSKNAAGPGRCLPDARGRLFTVESANNALVLVRKVVRDAVTAYEELMRLRTRRQELAFSARTDDRLEELRIRVEQLVSQLKRHHEELTDIGCELKDFTRGIVDFPAEFEGRKVLLCWRLDEPEVAHWHEVKAGFAGRKPIDPSFGPGVRRPRPAETEPTEAP